jgi:hypothetical protein
MKSPRGDRFRLQDILDAIDVSQIEAILASFPV